MAAARGSATCPDCGSTDVPWAGAKCRPCFSGSKGGRGGKKSSQEFKCHSCGEMKAPWEGALCSSCFRSDRPGQATHFRCPDCGKIDAPWRGARCKDCFQKSRSRNQGSFPCTDCGKEEAPWRGAKCPSCFSNKGASGAPTAAEDDWSAAFDDDDDPGYPDEDAIRCTKCGKVKTEATGMLCSECQSRGMPSDTKAEDDGFDELPF